MLAMFENNTNLRKIVYTTLLSNYLPLLSLYVKLYKEY
jgi:hypothetical protein